MCRRAPFHFHLAIAVLQPRVLRAADHLAGLRSGRRLQHGDDPGVVGVGAAAAGFVHDLQLRLLLVPPPPPPQVSTVLAHNTRVVWRGVV